MSGSKPYWFSAKGIGWGWGPPVTWQGWVVLLLWAGALAAGMFLLRHHGYRLPFRLAYLLAMGVILGLICYKTGEPPQWRWNNRRP